MVAPSSYVLHHYTYEFFDPQSPTCKRESSFVFFIFFIFKPGDCNQNLFSVTKKSSRFILLKYQKHSILPQPKNITLIYLQIQTYSTHIPSRRGIKAIIIITVIDLFRSHFLVMQTMSHSELSRFNFDSRTFQKVPEKV